MRKNALCLFLMLILLPTILSAQETSGAVDAATAKTGGVKSLEKRIEPLEKAIGLECGIGCGNYRQH